MKKLLTLFAIALAVVVSSCSKFDDSAIWDKLNEQEQILNDHEKRIAALEELCKQMNTNINALQTLVEALEKRDYITNVSPVREDGEIVGYTISFANSDTITIYNGKDGKDGQDGQNGYTPQIGVMKDTDGIYYWTIDGEWLLDDNGNKIKAVGEDGRDGQDGTDGANGSNGSNGQDGQDGADGKDGITPRLKIENDYWYVSYDEGATWIELGKATGEDGADGSDGEDGDSIFSSVTQDDEYVYFNLADGTIITLPKHDDGNDDTVKPVFEINGDGNYIVEAVGGTVAVKVTTNLEYDVIIPNEALAWISLADTRAVREETLTFNVAKNEDSEERSATVNLCAKGGDILQTITIKQKKSNTISCANNEVIYTTKYGYPIELNITEGFGGDLMSHTYENSYGRISFDNDVVSIPNEAFKNCTTLTTIVLPNSLSTINSSAFENCTSLTSITIPDSVTKIGKSAFSDCTSLTSVTIPDSITEIGDSAFSDCTSLTSITIPDSVTKIGKSAFSDCTSLTSITIPDSVTSIGYYAFYGCSSLKEFKGKFASVDGRCLVVDEKLIFFAQYGLTEYTIPDGVTSIGDWAFRGCSSLTSITIPDGVTSIGDCAFDGCSSLTSITIPDSVTSIGYYAFDGCSSLKEFKGKFASVDGRCLVVDEELIFFAQCGLTEYTIPDSVTSIGYSAFRGCSSLTSITIPDGVTSIGDYAFDGCSSLKEIYCKSTTPPTGGYKMFYNNASGRKIYVPTESVEAYKAAYVWSAYADDIYGYDFENNSF